MGLGGRRDWQLITTIADKEYAFVTNNRTDFLDLYSKQELHAGLVIIVPSARSVVQEKLFRAALIHIGQRSLVNMVVEVTLEGDKVHCEDYPLPP